MRKLVVNTFVTLDGIMQAPGGPEEDSEGSFKYGGWSFHYWDDMMGKTMDDFMVQPFDLLLGRKTYEIFAAHWPKIENEPAADKLNSVKKYVVSTTLNSADWNNSLLIKSDAVNEIRKLKEEKGPEIQVHGSSNLVQTLLRNNLADEYNLWIFPVTVGEGKRLFGEGTIAADWKLIESQVSSTGVVINKYQPGGKLKTGSFALEDTGSETKN